MIAILLKPQGLAANDGISYYGVYARTVGPMAAGLLGSAFFSWQAAEQLHDQHFKLAELSLIIFALLTIIIVITPYSVSNFLDWLHTAACQVKIAAIYASRGETLFFSEPCFTCLYNSANSSSSLRRLKIIGSRLVMG
jgi:cytochrome bd-type quinol oxidase subunit 2